jgi:hypothetical protein
MNKSGERGISTPMRWGLLKQPDNQKLSTDRRQGQVTVIPTWQPLHLVLSILHCPLTNSLSPANDLQIGSLPTGVPDFRRRGPRGSRRSLRLDGRKVTPVLHPLDAGIAAAGKVPRGLVAAVQLRRRRQNASLASGRRNAEAVSYYAEWDRCSRRSAPVVTRPLTTGVRHAWS